MSKDDYILRSISKLRHKKWELYALTKIIHSIDRDIEFVCQQLVRLPNGKRALTDVYFPQFNIHLEIDEGHHSTLEAIERDKKRSEQIISVTEMQIKRISIKNLETFDEEINTFVSELKKSKEALIEEKSFTHWDYEGQFNPEQHINRGYISLDIGAMFRTHRDALQCFGYSGGNYQRASWKIPNQDDIDVWFPKLYENKKWNNELSADGNCIYERSIADHESYRQRAKDNACTRVVFGHETDTFGKTLYRFKGVFKYDENMSKGNAVTYKKICDRYKLPQSQ